MNETSEKILEILEGQDGPISGEKISEMTGVTRSAVWKHINELKELGYSIDSSRSKGYELKEITTRLLPHEIKKHLKTDFIGRDIRYFKNTPSTTWVAKDLCSKEDAENFNGTILIAEEQTGGVGRLGRAWFSPSGGIWISVILKPSSNRQTVLCHDGCVNCGCKNYQADVRYRCSHQMAERHLYR